MSDGKPVIDEAWDSAVGTLHWIKSLLLGEFVDNRPLSALIVEMMANFAPFVVIVTSARDAVAVIVRLARHPEKRDETMEWVVLAACMITLALPLVAAAGGAAFAGVGAVVGGIAGSELGAALRAVMLLLVKEAAKLGDVIRFLQKFVKGDLIAFLRAIEFAKYERALLMAFDKTTAKLLEICRGFRSHLERFKYFDDVKRAIATLEHWEREFYAVQIAATKKLPLALAELQLRLTKVLAQNAPKESHAVNAAVKAMPPTKAVIPTQYIEDTAGKSLKPMLSEVSDGKSTSVKAPSRNPSAPAESAGGAGGGNSGKPPRKEKPQKADKPPEGPNTKRQEVVDLEHHNALASVGKFDYTVKTIPDGLVQDSRGVYGYLPEEGTEFAKPNWSVDWDDPEQVAHARQVRLEYHQGLEDKAAWITDMRARGVSDDDIARQISDMRNKDRMAAYPEEELPMLYARNLKKYNNPYGPTYEDALKKYGSPQRIIESSLKTNPAMDVLTGIAKVEP